MFILIKHFMLYIPFSPKFIYIYIKVDNILKYLLYNPKVYINTPYYKPHLELKTCPPHKILAPVSIYVFVHVLVQSLYFTI